MSDNTETNIPSNVTPIEQAPSVVAQNRDVMVDVVNQSFAEMPIQPTVVEQVAPQEAAPVSGKPEKFSFAQKMAMGVGAAVLAVGGGLLPHHGKGELPKDFKNPSPTDIYPVQKGDTLTEVAEKVAQNTPIKETMQEAKEDIVNRNSDINMTETSGLQEGEALRVPANGDLDPNAPGYQLNPNDTPK